MEKVRNRLGWKEANRHNEMGDAYLKPKSRAGMIFTRVNIMKE